MNKDNNPEKLSWFRVPVIMGLQLGNQARQEDETG
jgi:hypothetical protein